MRSVGRSRIGVGRGDDCAPTPPIPYLVFAVQPRERLGTGFLWRLRHPDQDRRDPTADLLGKAKEFVKVKTDKTPCVPKVAEARMLPTSCPPQGAPCTVIARGPREHDNRQVFVNPASRRAANASIAFNVAS